ncbi:CASP-like protein 2C1 [Neltuma alba]|uniref:CASP-like protein 2C1 n=1 Tax=Neltuma alba TaxID=207710 RepID=UPI0010A4DB00|nr:CASP-like protein 2C1 [Prosopis alba]XP_028775365.1 CASP-like protein 2C1 [Prosopis alba]XP_028775366.1 CASP-like protein 2C1 [Prosopis alba]
MKMEALREARSEIYLRVSAILVLVLTACLVAFDSQTKVIIYTITKKATYKDLEALKILVYVTSAAAVFNFLQICKHLVPAFSGGKSNGYLLYLAWFCFLLDQVGVYVTFGSNTAAMEAATIALNGAKALQWLKVCDKFTRFCIQIGVALLCGYVASFIMAIISCVSAYNLFRLYSSSSFLRLKLSKAPH